MTLCNENSLVTRLELISTSLPQRQSASIHQRQPFKNVRDLREYRVSLFWLGCVWAESLSLFNFEICSSRQLPFESTAADIPPGN